jgi:hypothetical protein
MSGLFIFMLLLTLPPSLFFFFFSPYSTSACFRLDDGITYAPTNPLLDGGITASRYKPHVGANLTNAR